MAFRLRLNLTLGDELDDGRNQCLPSLAAMAGNASSRTKSCLIAVGFRLGLKPNSRHLGSSPAGRAFCLAPDSHGRFIHWVRGGHLRRVSGTATYAPGAEVGRFEVGSLPARPRKAITVSSKSRSCKSRRLRARDLDLFSGLLGRNGIVFGNRWLRVQDLSLRAQVVLARNSESRYWDKVRCYPPQVP
jgi:hypothetical protein